MDIFVLQLFFFNFASSVIQILIQNYKQDWYAIENSILKNYKKNHLKMFKMFRALVSTVEKNHI